jgi:predicted transcriptional regulator
MPKPQHRIAVELPEELESKVASLAAITGRSQAELVTEAVESYIANTARWQQDMQEALDGIGDGGHDGDDVLNWLDNWGTERELPRPSLRPVR